MRVPGVLDEGGWLGRGLAVGDLEQAHLRVRKPARPDQEGDGCSTLETQSDPAPNKPALQTACSIHHALGRTGCRPTAEGERKSVAGPQVRHHVCCDLGVAGEVVLDLDATSNIELTVDEGVKSVSVMGSVIGASHDAEGRPGRPLRRGGQGRGGRASIILLERAQRRSGSPQARHQGANRDAERVRGLFVRESLDRHEMKDGPLLVG